MNTQAIPCGRCQTALPVHFYNQADLRPCPHCETPVRALVFPAASRPMVQGALGEDILTPDDAGCFYHPAKRVVVTCDSCGRFLCSLCDCAIGGQHLCPACLETGRTKGKLKALETKQLRWDSIALALAIIPMLFFYATLVTAPAVIYITIRYSKAPGRIPPLSRWRFVIAVILSLLQIAGWIIGFVLIFFAIFMK